MLKKDNLISGIILAAAAFWVSSVLFKAINSLFIYQIFPNQFSGVRTQFIYMLGVVSCLIPFHITGRQKRYLTQRGIVAFTIIATLFIAYYFKLITL